MKCRREIIIELSELLAGIEVSSIEFEQLVLCWEVVYLLADRFGVERAREMVLKSELLQRHERDVLMLHEVMNGGMYEESALVSDGATWPCGF